VFSSTFFITQGISMTAVLVRVVMGISYDNTTMTGLGTAISTNSGQLTPFASKLNPGQTTKVQVGGSGSPANE
jgi:hypothetical protein